MQYIENDDERTPQKSFRLMILMKIRRRMKELIADDEKETNKDKDKNDEQQPIKALRRLCFKIYIKIKNKKFLFPDLIQ